MIKYIIKHKWYVLCECWKRKLYWRGITHDLSKLLPSEFIHYKNYFYSDCPSIHEVHGDRRNTITLWKEDVEEAFNVAWLNHIHRNKHHWQYWVLRNDDGTTVCIPMPDKYKIEMLCDWIGAGKAMTGKDNCREWYLENKDKMLLHQLTRDWIESQLKI